MEEVGLNIIPTKVIHEDSNLDKEKDLIFIRLVYLCELNDDIKNIKLQEEEHSEYRLINSLDELKNEKISPFLIDLFNNDL
jgi:8-oxo-dGTP diphosphatase